MSGEQNDDKERRCVQKIGEVGSLVSDPGREQRPVLMRRIDIGRLFAIVRDRAIRHKPFSPRWLQWCSRMRFSEPQLQCLLAFRCITGAWRLARSAYIRASAWAL